MTDADKRFIDEKRDKMEKLGITPKNMRSISSGIALPLTLFAVGATISLPGTIAKVSQIIQAGGISGGSLSGIWWEEGGEQAIDRGGNQPGRPALVSTGMGMLFKGNKMYTFQIGAYHTEQEIIDDTAGLRGSKDNYATYTLKGSKLTLKNNKYGTIEECEVVGTDINCETLGRFVKK